MARFTLPRDIYFGDNAIEELGNIKDRKRAFIVTGGQSMKKNGALEKIEGILTKSGISTCIFDGVEPDPSIETVQKGAQAMTEFSPDLIVAIGGGSPIDAAKAMWVFYEYPSLAFEDILTPFSMPTLRKKAIFVAIPSTSGTASEVTAFSVITDYKKGVKYPLADFEITPDIAILDFSIPRTMPKSLTANTGMDALTHAIEGFTATLRSPFSNPLALEAITLVFDNLHRSYLGNDNARENMHIAQCLAGMCFSNALLGICHSIAHKIGAVFDLPHGLCNAILLPYVIEFNRVDCEDLYAQIARHLGLTGTTTTALTDSLVSAIKQLASKVGIPHSFTQAGVPEKIFHDKLDSIASAAALDPCTASNPRPAAAPDIQAVLSSAFYGEGLAF